MGRTIDNLQGLRGIACLLVVAFHLSGWERTYGISTPVFREFLKFGECGVDLFFVLSGFIITHVNARDLGRPSAVPRYLFRRYWRILPTCWAATIVCAACVSLSLNQPAFSSTWVSDWTHYLLLLPGEPANPYVPAWTLTFEAMFYAAFTVLMLLPPRVGVTVLTVWGVAVLACSVQWEPGRNPYFETAVSPFVLEFLGGCIVAALIGRGMTGFGRSAVLVGMVYLVGAGVAVAGWSGEPWTTLPSRHHQRVLIFGPAAVLVVYGLVAAELRGTSRLPVWLRRVGDASYSIYLTHFSVLPIAVAYGCYLPHSRWPHAGWLLATFLGCLIAGFLFYFAIERPLLLLAKPRKAKRAAIEQPGPVAVHRKAA